MKSLTNASRHISWNVVIRHKLLHFLIPSPFFFLDCLKRRKHWILRSGWREFAAPGAVRATDTRRLVLSNMYMISDRKVVGRGLRPRPSERYWEGRLYPRPELNATFVVQTSKRRKLHKHELLKEKLQHKANASVLVKRAKRSKGEEIILRTQWVYYSKHTNVCPSLPKLSSSPPTRLRDPSTDVARTQTLNNDQRNNKETRPPKHLDLQGGCK